MSTDDCGVAAGKGRASSQPAAHLSSLKTTAPDQQAGPASRITEPDQPQRLRSRGVMP
jgi:hypothetical protein